MISECCIGLRVTPKVNSVNIVVVLLQGAGRRSGMRRAVSWMDGMDGVKVEVTVAEDVSCDRWRKWKENLCKNHEINNKSHSH